MIAWLKENVVEIECQVADLYTKNLQAEKDRASAYGEWKKCKDLLYAALQKVQELEARVDSLGKEKAKVVEDLEASKVFLECSQKLVADMEDKQDAVVKERVKIKVEVSMKRYKEGIEWPLDVQQSIKDHIKSLTFRELL
ncbi:hypothetical protein J5N97_016870 [Dioscorea zingiberensis]|uniref:Uncharacterized protein n=1 Tax=Dioscorea zingiberensis TaxID=325984 RepID=A0A9D5CMN2_9LILI|nr:hypothetical protein J5N97_016870 [Dioscorea zingiberensis]